MEFSDEIIKKVHARLVEAAKGDSESFVFYSEIIQIAGLASFGEATSGVLGWLLLYVNEYDRRLASNANETTHPMLSAIAISKDGQPSNGFFDLAKEYGKLKSKDDELTFWLQEVKALRDYWQHELSGLSNTYLIVWNPNKGKWTNLEADWEAIQMGYKPILRWSCGNTKKILRGDRVFMMVVGASNTGIVASAWVTEEPFIAENWNKDSNNPNALYIKVELDALLHPEKDTLLNPLFVSADFNWHPQNSGITIPSDVASRLEAFWQQHIQGDNIETAIPIVTDKKYREGSRTQVSTYRYERDPHAREACIQHYGIDCVVCGFNFGKVFGEIGEGFIHVHHLKPIAQQQVEYEIDPIQDLRPVCPNCHAMLHRQSPPYSIEELISKRRS